MSIKIISSWGPPRSCQSSVQSWTMDYRTMFPVKCRVQDNKFGTEFSRLLLLLPQIHSYTYTHFISLSLRDGFPVRVEQMTWTRRHSNTQGEKSVLTVDDFSSDAGYALTKKLSLDVFMCSCAALHWQWRPSYSNNFFFFNCSTNASVFMIHNVLLIVVLQRCGNGFESKILYFFFNAMQNNVMFILCQQHP